MWIFWRREKWCLAGNISSVLLAPVPSFGLFPAVEHPYFFSEVLNLLPRRQASFDVGYDDCTFRVPEVVRVHLNRHFSPSVGVVQGKDLSLKLERMSFYTTAVWRLYFRCNENVGWILCPEAGFCEHDNELSGFYKMTWKYLTIWPIITFSKICSTHLNTVWRWLPQGMFCAV